MAAIRVLQIFTVMDRGGAESMIMNYYRAMDRSKIQFDFLVHRSTQGAFDEEIKQLGGTIYKMPPINPLKPKTYYNRLRQFFKEHAPYAIVHSHLNTFSCFPLKIAEECSIPCRIAHAHIAIEPLKLSDFLPHNEGVKESLKKIIKLQLKKRIHQHATHFFSCGEKAGLWLFGHQTKFTIINNAIDAQRFALNETIRKSYQEDFNIKNQLVIGHVGRFSSQKNHSYLLKIFKEVTKINHKAVLILIGDGPLRPKIEQEAKELDIYQKIKFLGVRTDIPELYQLLDVFVFPSFYEGLPVTLVEAQAAGLKVFASNTITREVALSPDIEYLSINEAPRTWATAICRKTPVEKNNNFQLIKEKGYDIYKNTETLSNFYTKQLTKNNA